MIARTNPIPAWALALVLVALHAGPAQAQSAVDISEIGVWRGDLCIVLSLTEAFDAETRRSIERGFPITVRFTTELWRRAGTMAKRRP